MSREATDLPTGFFSDFPLGEALKRSIEQVGYTETTPIQHAVITPLLEGKNVMGQAVTGSGKTAAFLIPFLERFEPGQGKVLVLTPTRELANQIAEEAHKLGRFTRHLSVVLVGGVPIRKQENQLAKDPDLYIGTPGRIKDLCKRRILKFDRVKAFVLDEFDKMLDMGFVDDVFDIFKKVPPGAQIALFSATLPERIERMAKKLTRGGVRVALGQSEERPDIHEVYHVLEDVRLRFSVLQKILKDLPNDFRAIIFCRTKRSVARIAERLKTSRFKSAEIHGDLGQSQRDRALESFKQKKIQILVATDVASRGLDIHEVTHIINYEMPNDDETYVHRIGRTARIGASGIAINLVGLEEVQETEFVQLRMYDPELEVHRHKPDHKFTERPRQGRPGGGSSVSHPQRPGGDRRSRGGSHSRR